MYRSIWSCREQGSWSPWMPNMSSDHGTDISLFFAWKVMTLMHKNWLRHLWISTPASCVKDLHWSIKSLKLRHIQGQSISSKKYLRREDTQIWSTWHSEMIIQSRSPCDCQKFIVEIILLQIKLSLTYWSAWVAEIRHDYMTRGGKSCYSAQGRVTLWLNYP